MIRPFLLLAILATSVHAGKETPLQYLIKCLGVATEGGKVTESWSNLVWPNVLDQEPPVGPGHSFGHDATLKIQWQDGSWKDFLAANGFQRSGLIFEDIPEIRKLFGNSKDMMFSRSLDLPRLGPMEITVILIEEKGKGPVLDLTIGQHVRHYVRPDTKVAEPSPPAKPAAKPADKAPAKVQAPSLPSKGGEDAADGKILVE